ncbi:hypothetical protein N0V90_011591 [Kalmusia sp. IMI 367209]|nr:hypothetical protein N0V90_011591 [Kalmusia sp. IMI 367209]
MSKGKTPSTRAKPKSNLNATVPVQFAKPSCLHPTAVPPLRVHSSSYHYPLILDDKATSAELLRWFEGIEEARNMPWRKSWIDPAEYEGKQDQFEKLLAKRAYEVWVSEVMLQQTRVSTVIPYFKTWTSKWPTVQSLAKASHDDVLSVWKGLGYYSRATRLHEGAQSVVSNASPKICEIPSAVTDLQKIPGIGRYTAGAVSSIAFGEAEPVLDGNVARVLSRQLGLFVDVKDKKSGEVLWEVADQLVKSVAGYPGVEKSKVPGQWNQALMELGSTICTPKPKCVECPIRKTCRVYAEGEMLSVKRPSPVQLPDIEDACTLCQQLDTEDLATAPEDEDDETEKKIPEKPTKRRKIEQKASNTISNYFTINTTKPKTTVTTNDAEDDDVVDAITSKKRRTATTSTTQTRSIVTYCSLYPKKMPKKKVPEENAVVCVIEARLADGRRLLASLWQFPQYTLTDIEHDELARKASAENFACGSILGTSGLANATHVSEIGSLVHIFTHLKLTMHVQHFRVDMIEDKTGTDVLPARKWVEAELMESETLSTGMRKCWDLMQSRH